MATTSIVGLPVDIKGNFVTASQPLGTEDVNTVVGAGQIGIIIDSAVDLNSFNIDTVLERIRDAYREQVLKVI
jgi:hypothetical protein